MLTLNDGRSELWQWDTGRKLTVDADCSQVHFSNKVFGRSIDVDVVDGAAIIPDILLQSDNDLNVWAFVGTAENGYTKISKTFKVNRRNKPADYVFTPHEQITLSELVELTTAAAEHPPVPGDNGCWMIWDVSAGAYRQSDVPVTVAPVDRTADMTQPVGRDQDGRLWTAPGGGGGGTSGVTPTIGDNGNWYLGDTDTGKPSRGETGPQGPAGADGKSAYQYAQDGGYTGTEAEFAAKLAAEIPAPYTLPIASSTVLGGVQPVAKTDSMTQSVGVDASGALWAPPGSGVGASTKMQETVLASGVVASGTAKWHNEDTGLTVADLQEWKVWGFVSVSNTQDVTRGIGFGSVKTIYFGGAKKCSAVCSWFDDERKAIQVIKAISGDGYIGVNNNFFNNSSRTFSASNLVAQGNAIPYVTNETDKVYFYTNEALTEDASYKIVGLIK